METPSTSKQITIDVPADRVPEFYAFYGRFLAAEGRFGKRRGGGRRGGPHGRRCHHPRHDDVGEAAPQQEPAA